MSSPAPLRDTGGEPIGAAFIGEDITERERIRSEWERLTLAIEHMAGWFMLMDPAGLITDVNPAFERISGHTKSEAIGRQPQEVLASDIEPPGSWEDMRDSLAAGRQWSGTWILEREDGSQHREEATISPIRDASGALTSFVCVTRDVTLERAIAALLQLELRERIDVAAAVGRLAHGHTREATAAAVCRELRGLPGVDVAAIFAFERDGEAAMLAACAGGDFPMAVGDRLSAARAAYLAERAHKGPWAERWTPQSMEEEHGDVLTAAGFRRTAYAPIRNGEGLLGVVAIATLDEGTAEYMVTHLPVIAEFGAAASVLLAPGLEADRRLATRHAFITKTIASRAFYPVFQPIVDLDDGGVVGYEALTRFNDGAHPGPRFAEAWAVGVGADLEIATLEEAIRLALELPAAHWLNVNVSPRFLADPERVRAVLERADRPLVVEITEHDTVADYRVLRAAIARLGDSVRTAVDDVGAGIANFAHIVELRPDLVKLDVGLIRGINADSRRQAIVVAMRHFAQATGCRLIAEGVETEAEAKTVAALGVAFGQGNWFGRPVSVGELVPAPSAAQAHS